MSRPSRRRSENVGAQVMTGDAGAPLDFDRSSCRHTLPLDDSCRRNAELTRQSGRAVRFFQRGCKCCVSHSLT